ncbi:hypothetical protein BC828DRAFT_60472 [Blastocladiella britannica]|nr:hypothetical protein BC828DRAFT_60472 [Blastocladiella britannica]
MRLAHPVLGDHVAQCIVDANGLTVQVKTLTAVENLESMMREHDGGSHLPSDAPPLPPSALRLHTDHATTSANSPDAAEPAFLRSLLATDRAPTSDPALMTAASSGGPSQHDQVLRGPRGYSHRAMQTVADVLHLLAVLVRRKPHRVLFLYHAKAFNVLRRLVELNNFDIMIRSLKLIKTMMPFMSRKWRQANIGVISRIYHHLTPKLVDDYLMTTDADSEGAEGMVRISLFLVSTTLLTLHINLIETRSACKRAGQLAAQGAVPRSACAAAEDDRCSRAASQLPRRSRRIRNQRRPRRPPPPLLVHGVDRLVIVRVQFRVGFRRRKRVDGCRVAVLPRP